MLRIYIVIYKYMENVFLDENLRSDVIRRLQHSDLIIMYFMKPCGYKDVRIVNKQQSLKSIYDLGRDVTNVQADDDIELVLTTGNSVQFCLLPHTTEPVFSYISRHKVKPLYPLPNKLAYTLAIIYKPSLQYLANSPLRTCCAK